MSSIRKDLHHNINVVQAFNSAAVSSSTTTSGIIIDTRGYGSVEFILSVGGFTDGTYTLNIQEGNASNLSDVQSVADRNLLGTEAGNAVSAANGIGRVGYIVGKYRYVRMQVVSSGVTSGASAVHGIAVLGTPDLAPTTAT